MVWTSIDNCEAVLWNCSCSYTNTSSFPYSQVDYRAKLWACNFCFQRNQVSWKKHQPFYLFSEHFVDDLSWQRMLSINSTFLDSFHWPFSLAEPRPEHLLMSLFHLTACLFSVPFCQWFYQDAGHRKEIKMLFCPMCFQCAFCTCHLLFLPSMKFIRCE